jgi:hypothetical protein
MDKGAHFHKCDSQVHTPRDINWDGASAVTDDERHQYAQEFVAACLLEPFNAEIRRRAAADLRSFGPDWDAEADRLEKEAEEIEASAR